MATSQQKLKLKMMSIDTWSKREQLCLASSVLRSGDQNWVSVSRSLRSFAEPNRPQDWLSPRNCAAQYNNLLEKTGAHKRKRGERHPSAGSTDSQQGETAGEIILKQLTQERIEELQQFLETYRKEYNQIQKELELIQAGKLDNKLLDMCQKIDEENEKKLQEQSSHLMWLEERERKKEEVQQAFKQQRENPSPAKTSHQDISEADNTINSPSVTDQLNIDISIDEVRESTSEVRITSNNITPVPAAPTPSSPLLTSLLRSPTSTTGPNVSKSSSPGQTKLNFNLASPTGISSGLKSLLSTAIGEESPCKPTTSTPPTTAPTLTRLLDLPLNSPGKPLPELSVGEETEVTTTTTPFRQEEEVETELETFANTEELIKVEETPDSTTLALEKIKEELLEGIPEALQKEMVNPSDVVVPKLPSAPPKISDEPPLTVEEVSAVIEELSELHEEQQESVSTTEATVVEETVTEEVSVAEDAVEFSKEAEMKEETTISTDHNQEAQEMNVSIDNEVEVGPEEPIERIVEESVVDSELAPEVAPELAQDLAPEPSLEPIAVEMVPKLEEEVVEEQPVAVKVEVEVPVLPVVSVVEDEKVDEKEEKPASIDTKPKPGSPKLTRRPLRVARRKNPEAADADDKLKVPESGPTTRRSSGRGTKVVAEEVEAETVHEAPELAEPVTPNVIRKKAPPPPLPLMGPSLSPAPSSGMDSTPNSPTSSVSTVTDDDREYKAWKKSILLIWREISSHKNASLFQKPISQEHVPGYRSVIYRPMDLNTIKKNIESGAIRTTTEFHRDISLMFLNSIMFNPVTDEVYKMAKEMFAETNVIIQEFINAQLLAQNLEVPRPHRRETRDSTRRTESLSSHEETPSKPEEGKTRASKRASVVAAVVDDTKKRRSRAVAPSE